MPLSSLVGHDASREPAWFEDPRIDAVATGDGEEVMPALADALESRGDLKKVPGLMLNTRQGPLLYRPGSGTAQSR